MAPSATAMRGTSATDASATDASATDVSVTDVSAADTSTSDAHTCSLLPRPLDGNCPHRRLLDQITDRWSVLVLTTLDAGPLRFNTIKRRLGGVTQKALTQSLRRMERNGLVARRVVPASPVAVEYRITSLGRTVQAPIAAMYAWTLEHLADVEQARTAFDTRGDA